MSNSGGLGLIGAGSMHPETLQEHIRKCKLATQNPFGVNVPLLYPEIDRIMQIIEDEGVKIVFTSAGNPATWTSWLKERGIIVVHVIANEKFALKSELSGVDAIVAEGFEAGGHNGREETTTLCLIPQIRAITNLPLIAAGGISSGRSMAAVMALGAEGVQIGSRFAASFESSAHENFKNAIVKAGDGDTRLSMKQLTPVRLLKSPFAEAVWQLESRDEHKEGMIQLLGRGRAKKGMFEGDMEEGELEIGQVSAQIREIKSAKEIVQEIIAEYNSTIHSFKEF